jgi:hypothetical protein
MSDISSQLIKDSYNYILQSDLSTGVVYRIGGGIPVNPIFLSGLTIISSFKFSNGSEQAGYVLISDSFGNATWVENPSGPSGNYLYLSGGTVTGPTIFTSGLTANTISATTYFNLPTDIRVTGGTYTGSTIIFTNNTGGTFSVTGITTSSAFTGGTVTGATNFTGGLTANTISATTYQNLPPTPFLPLSGGTITGPVIIKDNGNPLTITTDNYSPGSSGNILYFGDFTGSTNGKSINSRSNGGSIPGNLILQELNNGNVGVNKNTSDTLNYNLDVNGTFGATSVSATTYLNLPSSGGSFTGGTVSGATNFTNGLTANTISATTYYNLPPSSVKSINSVSGNTNAGSNQNTDYIYFATNTITITLPTAISNTNSYVIKNVGTGTITINTTSSQTIDGSLTALIKVQYLSLTLISDGANWNII